MTVPEFDMMVLDDIAGCMDGWSREDLVSKYGFEILKTVDFLLENQLIKEHTSNLAPFFPHNADYIDPPLGNLVATDTGLIEVKRWKAKTTLTEKERWKERIFGFVSALLLWALQEFINWLL